MGEGDDVADLDAAAAAVPFGDEDAVAPAGEGGEHGDAVAAGVDADVGGGDVESEDEAARPA